MENLWENRPTWSDRRKNRPVKQKLKAVADVIIQATVKNRHYLHEIPPMKFQKSATVTYLNIARQEFLRRTNALWLTVGAACI